MKKAYGEKRYWLGIPVLVLVFGMTVVGCVPEDPYDPYYREDNTIYSVTISLGYGSDTPKVGSVLSIRVENTRGSSVSGVSYQWKRADTQFSTFTNISGATSSNYTPVIEDTGKYIRVEARNSDTTYPVESVAAGPVDGNQAAKPTADITGGTVVPGQAITLTSTTSSANIYYTLNGTTPSTSSTQYSSSQKPAINTNNTTLRAIATHSSMVASEILTATYNVSNLSFTQRTPPASFYSILAVAYGSNRFVAGGDARQLFSSTNGTTWTAATWSETPSSFIIYGIAVNNTGIFVAVGRNFSGGVIFRSTNGTSWTQVTTSTFGTDWIRDIAFGGGRFVAVGEGGKIAHSTDGTTWTAITPGTGVGTTQFGTGSSGNIYGVTYGNNRFVAVGVSGKMTYSSNGTTWTAVETSSFYTTAIYGITYGGSSGNEMFIAVGGGLFSGTAIASSKDGVTWTSSVSASSGSQVLRGYGLNRVAWGGDKFVAVGNGGVMMFSVDGLNWAMLEGGTNTGQSQFDTGAFSSINDIVYGGGRFLAVGSKAGAGLFDPSSPEMAASN